MNKKSNQVKTKALHYDRLGRGVIDVGTFSYSVFNLIPGEEAFISLQGDQAKVQSLISKSPLRAIPPCKVYEFCGSCQLQHLNYKEQLNFKTNYVKEIFEEHDIKITLEPIIGMDQPYRYRNKNQFGYGFDKNGKVITGLFEERSHKLVLVNDCLIQDEVTNELFHSIKDIMQEMKIHPFREDAKKGIIRYVLIKRGIKTNQTLVTIVTSVESFPGKNEFFKAIIKKNPHITTLIHNINSRKTSVVLGDLEKVAFGKGYIEDTMMNLTFQISSKSFYQINPIQTEKLYQKVIDYASLNGSETVIDTYSGVGTIGLVLAKYAKQVYCVELNKDAHSDAIRNAKNNKIQNVQFFNQDATQFMVSLSREKVVVDVVIMDPTRHGSTPEFINALLSLRPKKIVYVSCEPATQARDIKLLIEKKYKIERAIPVDMFPQTFHVENIVLLSLKIA